MIDKSTIDAISDLAGLRAPAIDTPDGGKALALPQGYTLHRVKPLDDPLTHIKQLITLHDAESFIAYVNAYKRHDSRIFAEPGFLASNGAPSIRAVLDYHDPQPGDSEPVPRRAAHVALYMPRYSEAWTRWTKACSGPLGQIELAEMIEECREDIRQPSAAELLDIVRTFKAQKKVSYDSVVYQPNGSVKLDYSDNVEKVGNSVNLPEQMTLGIPVYYRGDLFAVGLFIRFKLSSGVVAFSLKMDRADRLEDEAFSGLAKGIGEATGVPLHIGRLG